MSHFHSNLPPSCSAEMVEAFHGFNRSDDTFECSVCMRECDPDNYRKHLVTTKTNGLSYTEDVCSECINMCDICGEWMDDATKLRGPLVNYREVANDGKLTFGHADCVGEWMDEDLETPSGKHWSEMATDKAFNALIDASRAASKDEVSA